MVTKYVETFLIEGPKKDGINQVYTGNDWLIIPLECMLFAFKKAWH